MPLTITATASGSGSANGILLAPQVFTGASATQDGVTAASESVTVPALAITPGAAGSVVVGAVGTGASATAFSSATGHINSVANSTVVTGTRWGVYRSPVTTGRARTYGWNTPAQDSGNIFIGQAEVVAAGELELDSSTPAAVSASGAKTATSASFTPPAGAVIIVPVVANWSGTGDVVVAVSDSAGAYAWTELVGSGAADLVSIWAGISTAVNGSGSASLASMSATGSGLVVTDVSGSGSASLSSMSATGAGSLGPPPPGYPDGRLDGMLELYLGGTWVDVTDPTLPDGQQSGQLTSGQKAGAQQLAPASLPVALDNPAGTYSPRNAAGAYSGQLRQNTPARFSFASPYGSYLRLEGDGPDYASTPDASALHVTGSLEVRAELTLNDWRPCVLAARYGASGTPSWIWGLLANGTLQFGWYDSGGTAHAAVSTAVLGYSPHLGALSVSLDASTGTVAFAGARSADGPWAPIGDPVAGGGATSVRAGDQPLTVGWSAYGGVMGQFRGQVRRLWLYSGIPSGSLLAQDDSALLLEDGTSLLLEDDAFLVACPDFTAQPPGIQSFTDDAGAVWSVSGGAAVTARDYRLCGELASVVPQATVSGSAKAALTVSGRTRRMQQGKAPAIASPMSRAVLSQPGTLYPVAYWTMEGVTSTAFGPAVGPNLMTWSTAVPRTGTDTSFEASAALPALNGAVLHAAVPAYTGATAWVVRFLCKLGQTLPGSGDTAVLARLTLDSGPVQAVTLSVDSSGYLQLTGTSAGVTVFDSGATSFSAVGAPRWYSIEATSVTGAGAKVEYNVITLDPGAMTGDELSSPPQVTQAIPNVTGIEFDGSVLTDTVIGHASVQSAWASMFTLGPPLNAWRGEAAADRFARVCAENGVAFRLIGSPSGTAAMGPQPEGTLWQVLRDCAWTEQGIIFEPREILGVGLRTQASMLMQPSAVTLSFADATLPGAMLAADDDTDLVNDLTVAMPDGTTYRVVLDDWSPKSVAEPPVGAGRYAARAPLTFNVSAAVQLPDLAAWYLRLCTADAARYRQVGASFGIPGAPAEDMARLRAGDRLTITDVPAVYQTADIDQLVTGATEAFGPGRALTWDCAPYAPYSMPLPVIDTGDGGGGGDDGGGGGGTVPVPGYAQQLIDDFSSGTLDSGTWRVPVGGDGVSVSGGQLTIQAITGDEQVVACRVDGRDLSTGIFALKLSQSGTTADGTMFFFGLNDDPEDLDNYYEWQAFPLRSQWYSWADGAGATTSGDTGDQDILSLSVWANGDWLGLGNYGINGGNDVHVYRSSDGVNWTQIASFDVTGAVDESDLFFYFGTNYDSGETNPSDYVAAVDDVSFFTRQASDGTGEPVSLFGDGGGAVDTPGVYGGTIGVEIAAVESGTVDGVYLSAPDGIGLTSLPTQIGLWRADAATLVTSQSATWGEPDEFGRVFAPFDPAPTMSGATSYMATAFGDAGSFGYTSSASWPVTSGPLTGIDGGFYSTDDSMDYPSSQQSGWSFGLDVSFTPTGTSGGGGGGGGGSSGLQLAVYESGGNFPEPGPAAWPFGNATTTAVEYFQWGQSLTGDGSMGAFIAKCIANGLNPCVEIEAWHAGDGWNETPTYDDIMGGAWDTWLESAGTSIAAAGQDVIVIIIHEFNISGQYPWAPDANATIGYGSGPGGADLTPSQWIDLWSYIKAEINSTAGGHAKFMWACAAFTGGTSISPADYWPAADLPDLVGVDGYPKTTYAEEQGFFAGEFQATFDIIRGLGWEGAIALAEINLPQMESTGGERIEDFVADMAAAGVDMLIEFDDTAGWGLAAISADQVSRFLAAIAANYS